MKPSVLPVLTAILLAIPPRGSARVRSRVPAHRPVQVNRYVRLDQWAQANDFRLRRRDDQKLLELIKPGAGLAFNTDPRTDLRKAQINGVRVWLAFPLIYRDRRPYISEGDLAWTLAPVLAPPALPRGVRIRTICLDPGHGGKDPGYRIGGREEKRYTLLLAQELRNQLKAAGFRVVLTRNDDRYVFLESRDEIARRNKADLFVSLHFNAVESGRNEVKGAQTYCCTPAGATSSNARGEGDTRWVDGNRHDEKNMLLAYEVQRALVKNLPIEDRGVKRARFEVLREATMPAILIEAGFLSHPVEGKKITESLYRRQMAHAILSGIVNYKRLVGG